jgi:hypothetical protein
MLVKNMDIHNYVVHAFDRVTSYGYEKWHHPSLFSNNKQK